MKDFFISYNSADRTWAERIAWQLEEGGVHVGVIYPPAGLGTAAIGEESFAASSTV